jgi:CHAT domain-containing protein
MSLASRLARLWIALPIFIGCAGEPRAPAPAAAPAALDLRSQHAELLELVGAAERAGDRHAQALGRIALCQTEDALGFARAAGESLQQAIALADSLETPLERMQLEAMASSIELGNERFEAGERHARAWLAAALEARSAADEARARIMLARFLSGPAREAEQLSALALLPRVADPRARIDLLRGNALLLRERGDSALARAQVDEALALDSDGSAHVELLGLRGNLCLDLLEDDAAREAYARSEDRARAEGRSGFEAKFLHAQALLDEQQGAYEPALEKLQRARELLAREGSLSDLHELELTLAGVYQELALRADDAGQREMYREKQREICAAIAGPDPEHPASEPSAAARALCTLAIACEDEDRKRAAELLEQAAHLAAARDLPREAAQVEGAQAWLRYLGARDERDQEARDRDLDDSARLALQAANLFAGMGDTDNRFATLDTRLRALLELGRLDEAHEILLQASEELGLDVATRDAARRSSLPYPTLAYFEGHWQDWTARALAAASSDAQRARIRAEGFESAGRWRGRQLLARLLRGEDELHRAAEGVIGSRHAAGQLLARSNERGERADVRQRALEQRRLEDSRRTSEVAARALAAGRTALPPISAEGIRAALPGRDCAILEYVAGVADEVDPPRPQRLIAYVLTSEGLFSRELGDWGAIQEDALRFVAGLSGTRRESEPGSSSGYDGFEELARRGSALYRALVDAPLSGLPPALRAGLHQLVIVPAGALAVLPFEALALEPLASGAARPHYLVEDLECSYAPSSPVYAALRRREPVASASEALVIVDARYEARGTAPPNIERAPPPARLRQSLDEGCKLGTRVLGHCTQLEPVREATLQLSDIDSDTHVQRDLDIVVPGLSFHCGARACPAVLLRSDLARFSLIHIGAHAQPDFAAPQDSRILLAPDPDGRCDLRRRDIVELQLAARLVTLSACRGALGRDASGEGVLSLAHAFLLAGASSVVASLWDLDDEKASEFAQGFYHTYLDGSPGAHVARAAREAKLHMIEEAHARGGPVALEPGRGRLLDSADPYYWAPFVVIGSP